MSDDADNNKLSTQSYKGVRDFPPEEHFIERYIFEVWRNTAESFGYAEHGASILEPAELYRAKSGEELVGKQTYTFTDRGDREITLRPEMTPSTARMIAARRRELSFPVRWYSIQNLFRYERPQRGRLREHWQLNADIFGAEGVLADAETVLLAADILKQFGVSGNSYTIYINDRRLVRSVLRDMLGLDEAAAEKTIRLIDRKEKVEEEKFRDLLDEAVGEKKENLLSVLESRTLQEVREALPAELRDNTGIKHLEKLLTVLEENGLANVEFSPTLVRGLDYYTGFVFEGFDNNPENNRALFGGGRFDDLLSIFGEENVPAVGFGMGDVAVRDMLEVRRLMPDHTSSTDLFICTLDEESAVYAQQFAQRLRDEGVNVAVDVGGKKVGDQIQTADKHNVSYVLCIGENEMKSERYTLKELESGEERELKEEEIAPFLRAIRSIRN